MPGLNWKKADHAARAFTQKWGKHEPGGAILVFDQTEIRVKAAGGLADLNSNTAFDENTVARIASISKHFFCSMLLQHTDQVSVDDPLGDHLPELSEPLASVSVGRALDMTGGLPDMRECLTLLGLSVYTETSAAKNHEFMARQTRLNFEAGTEISYSNTGYRLVELILERKGIFFKDFLGNQVNAALRTGFSAPHVWGETVPNLIPGYWFNGSEWLLSSAGLQISASGSVTACAMDMATWAQALLKGEGMWQGLLDRLSAPRALKDGRATGYGLGIIDTMIDGRKLVGHGGSHPGFKSYLLMDETTGTGVVVLSNRDETDARGTAVATLSALLDLSLPQPCPDRLTDGLYVTEKGPFWLEVEGANATWLDDTGALYEDGNEWVSSRSATAPIRLQQQGDALVGEIAHVARTLRPVTSDEPTDHLNGLWQSSEGAFLSIEDGAVTMGAGPIRQTMPLRSLGGGRFLFTLKDSLWTKRVCLHCLEADRLELVLSRARMIEYKRLK